MERVISVNSFNQERKCCLNSMLNRFHFVSTVDYIHRTCRHKKEGGSLKGVFFTQSQTCTEVNRHKANEHNRF